MKQFGDQLLQGTQVDILGSVFTKVFLSYMHKSAIRKPEKEYAMEFKSI